jgi:hypothetical protein
VIVLCEPDREACPTLGIPGEILWTIPDPLLVEGTLEQRQRAFDLLAIALNIRIRLRLPLLEREKRERA